MRHASGHNYRNSSFIVNVAMGQIPRSTERISSCKKTLQFTTHFKDDIRHLADLKQQILRKIILLCSTAPKCHFLLTCVVVVKTLWHYVPCQPVIIKLLFCMHVMINYHIMPKTDKNTYKVYTSHISLIVH